MVRTLRLATIALSLASTLAAQRTWVVDSGRLPGYDFATIDQAVQAAAPGDVIEVRPAIGGYSAPTINKGIALLALGDVPLFGPMTIVGIPAGQSVSVKGFQMADTSNFVGSTPIVCQASPGTIHLEAIKGGGGRLGPGLQVTDCAHVSATECSLGAGTSLFFQLPNWNAAGGNVGVSALRSSLSLVRVKAPGAISVGVPSRPGFGGSWSGIVAKDSRLALAECEVGGGSGYCGGAPGFCFALGAPTAALVATNCTLTLRDTTLTGGKYDVGQCTGCGAPALNLQATGSILDPAKAHLTAKGVKPGQNLSLSLTSSVQAAFATFVSLPGPALAAPVGIWIDTTQMVQVVAGLSNVGVRTDLLRVPASFPRGLALGFQTLLIDAGVARLSTPVSVVLD